MSMPLYSRRALLSTGAGAGGILVAASQTYAAGTYDNVGDASQTPGPHDPREEALNPMN
jgi:oxalate decarboxylase